MNKLDQFAAAALPGLMGALGTDDTAWLAGEAYKIAEAMLEESQVRAKSKLQQKIEEDK